MFGESGIFVFGTAAKQKKTNPKARDILSVKHNRATGFMRACLWIFFSSKFFGSVWYKLPKHMAEICCCQEWPTLLDDKTVKNASARPVIVEDLWSVYRYFVCLALVIMVGISCFSKSIKMVLRDGYQMDWDGFSDDSLKIISTIRLQTIILYHAISIYC